jgi:hypothetical protein
MGCPTSNYPLHAARVSLVSKHQLDWAAGRPLLQSQQHRLRTRQKGLDQKIAERAVEHKSGRHALSGGVFSAHVSGYSSTHQY